MNSSANVRLNDLVKYEIPEGEACQFMTKQFHNRGVSILLMSYALVMGGMSYLFFSFISTSDSWRVDGFGTLIWIGMILVFPIIVIFRIILCHFFSNASNVYYIFTNKRLIILSVMQSKHEAIHILGQDIKGIEMSGPNFVLYGDKIFTDKSSSGRGSALYFSENRALLAEIGPVKEADTVYHLLRKLQG